MLDPNHKLLKLFRDGRNGFFFLIGSMLLARFTFLVGILPDIKWMILWDLITYLTSFIWGVYLVLRTIK